jgi:hypothetical protein
MDGDADAFERLLAPDFVFVDHQPVSWGSLTRDELLALASRLAAGPSYTHYTTRVHALDEHGGVFRQSEDDRTDAGGRTRVDFLTLVAIRDGQVWRVEQFTPEDLDVAVARYRDLTAPAIARRGDDLLLRHRGNRYEICVHGSVVSSHADLQPALDGLDMRYEATLAADERAVAALGRRGTAVFTAGDSAAMEELVGPTFTLVDHRAVGLGVVDREGIGVVFDAVTDRGAGYTRYTAELLALTGRGSVGRCREIEADRLGGTIETETVVLTIVADAAFERLEIFAAEDAEDALARFEELTAPGRARGLRAAHRGSR